MPVPEAGENALLHLVNEVVGAVHLGDHRRECLVHPEVPGPPGDGFAELDQSAGPAGDGPLIGVLH